MENRLTPSITVTATSDFANGLGATSLRQAITAVNAGNVPDNTIIVPPGLYKITLAGAAEDNNATGDFDIKHPILIKGSGAGATVIDGSGLDRIFHFQLAAAPAAYSATLSDLTIQGGVVAGGGSGGGIRVEDSPANKITLTMNRCTLQNNMALAGQSGGGIAVANGDLTMNSCTVTGNAADTDGGGITSFGGNISISAGTISNNTAGLTNVDGDGGGINAGGAGNIVVTGTVISGNTASGDGGGIAHQSIGKIIANALTISDNHANHGGGVSHEGSGDLNLGTGGFLGGAVVDGNSAVLQGGGIWRAGTGNLAVALTELQNNAAGGDGGGISVQSIAGTVTISNSTINNNHAVGAFGNGGGLDLENGAVVTLTNDTMSGNTAKGGGGGIFKAAAGIASLQNLTIVFNVAASGGGGIYSEGATLGLFNTIVAGNTPTSLGGDVNNNGAAGNFADGGGNLIGTNSGAASSFAVGFPNPSKSYVGGASPIDPRLGPLAANEGAFFLPNASYLLTHSLLPGSFAIAHGDSNGAPAKDERGVLRSSTSEDIGAFQTTKISFAISNTNKQVYESVFAGDGKFLSSAASPVAPGQFTALATASFGPGGDILLLGLGVDQQVYGARMRSDGSLVFGWFLVAPGHFTSLVADTVGTAGGSLPIVFAVATDGQVNEARFDAQGMVVSPWSVVAPGQFNSITAGQFGVGDAEVFGVSSVDHQVYAARLDTNGALINGWFLLAPGMFQSLAVTSRFTSAQELFGVGVNQQMYAATLDTNGNLAAGWFTTAAGTFTALTATTLGGGNLGVYALGTDQQVYEGIFAAAGGVQQGMWTVPRAGTFTALASTTHLTGKTEVLGVDAGTGELLGEMFDSTGAFTSGFFKTMPGSFAAPVFAP